MLNFEQIIGHDRIKKHLVQGIYAGKVSHAYIISGEDDAGKNMIARAYANLLQCEQIGKLEPTKEGKIMTEEEYQRYQTPCGVCRSCLQASSGNHPDIINVTHEKASIGVDDIRIQVNNDIQIKPYSSQYKIYIIDEAEKLTEQAQNALLKTIEEPPSYGIILLLTNNLNSLLQTILSRCVTLKLQAVGKELIKKHLMDKHQIPDYLADLSQSFSGGNVGKAVKYATSEEFTEKKNVILHIVKFIDKLKIYEMMDEIKKMTEHKGDMVDYFDLLTLWFRDVLLYKASSEVTLLTYKNEWNIIKEHSIKYSYDKIQRIMDGIEKAKLRLKANVNSDITLELMLLTIQEDS